MSCAYQANPGIEAAAFEAQFGSLSLNIFVGRSARFSHYGRPPEEDQAQEIDAKIVEILNRFSIPYFPVNIETGEPHAVSMVLHHARQTLQAVAEPDLDIDAPFMPS